ncbi:hypothetical protein MKEN_01087400 [Mycena kentingensis (nom. inval.)]|nr:hypothetical protein MKEN_01087400 [Mycena kentingensis (nom. inval.)]
MASTITYAAEPTRLAQAPISGSNAKLQVEFLRLNPATLRDDTILPKPQDQEKLIKAAQLVIPVADQIKAPYWDIRPNRDGPGKHFCQDHQDEGKHGVAYSLNAKTFECELSE